MYENLYSLCDIDIYNICYVRTQLEQISVLLTLHIHIRSESKNNELAYLK